MRLKLFALAALAAAALIAIPAVVSQASKVKKHDVHVPIHGATVESLAGGKSVQAAHDKCKLYGDSAVIFKQKATTNPDGTVTLGGKFTLSNKKGSVSGTVEVVVKAQ